MQITTKFITMFKCTSTDLTQADTMQENKGDQN